MIEISILDWCVTINGVLIIFGLMVGFLDYGCYPTFDLTSRQKVFWSILLPGFALGYIIPTIIVKLYKFICNINFFRWLAEENKKDSVKINKDYKNYCLKCRYLSYGKYGYEDIERKCETLNLDFINTECPCNGKLYEKR